jgi:hypothetical protein
LDLRRVGAWITVIACTGCGPGAPEPVAVVVRIRAPSPTDRSCTGVDTGAGLDAGAASSASAIERIYRPGERCVVFAAAGFDPYDTSLRAVAVRTRAVVAPELHVPPCLGETGAVLLSGLDPRAEYQLELALYDDRDFAAPEGIPPRPRLVSRQNLRYGSADAGVVCLSEFRCAAVYEQVTLRARQLCPTAPLLERCSLDIPFAGLCSLPR